MIHTPSAGEVECKKQTEDKVKSNYIPLIADLKKQHQKLFIRFFLFKNL